MADPQPSTSPPAPKKPRRRRYKEVYAPKVRSFFKDYAWFIARNLLGWILILAAPPLGVMLPGPGGLPVFLIGFALVTFPGKRRFTARFLRGRRFPIEHRAFAFTTLIIQIRFVIPRVIAVTIDTNTKFPSMP